MIVFGIIGYILRKLEIPMAPIVLTFVLGKMIENTLVQSLIYLRAACWASSTVRLPAVCSSWGQLS